MLDIVVFSLNFNIRNELAALFCCPVSCFLPCKDLLEYQANCVCFYRSHHISMARITSNSIMFTLEQSTSLTQIMTYSMHRREQHQDEYIKWPTMTTNAMHVVSFCQAQINKFPKAAELGCASVCVCWTDKQLRVLMNIANYKITRQRKCQSSSGAAAAAGTTSEMKAYLSREAVAGSCNCSGSL